MASPTDRYSSDVLAKGWQQAAKPDVTDHPVQVGLVVEDPSTGFVGAITRWENGLVVLEDRRGKIRSFPFGPGFWIDGKPVRLVLPRRGPATTYAPGRTASGSVSGPAGRAKVALASRIFVEGRHDAELVEKIWGDDLRHVGVVVEYLGGIDDLTEIVADFAPDPKRRLGVLADHLVPGSKEQRIADAVAAGPYGAHVLVSGHPYIDIWEAIKPARIGIETWPTIPKGQDWKTGICTRFGWPHDGQADIARAWQHLLGRVRTWTDLERPLLTEVERLIDFVTAD